MKFKIHFTNSMGNDDWFIASGDTENEVAEVARRGVEQRGGSDPWSEELSSAA